MMLTAAEPRKKGLTALYIDGEFAVDLDTEIFLKAGLHEGDELSDERLHGLIRAGEERRAERKAFYLLGFRPHSQRELERKLARSVPRETARRAAERMTELGYVNDAEYARTLARELFERKGYAAARVRLELARRGIDRETAEQAAEEAEPDPAEQARRVIEKKYARCLGDEKGRRRTVAALRRLGYRWEDIRGAMEKITADMDEDG